MTTPPASLTLPAQLIQTEQAVAHWLRTDGCRGYLGWLQMLARTVEDTSFSSVELTTAPPSKTVLGLEAMLSKLKSLTSSHPPLQSAQRFGNLAFRAYATALNHQLSDLILAVLEPTSNGHLLPQLLPLLRDTSPFGNSSRIDYGTGHEAAFMLFLYALRVAGVLAEGDDRDVVLRIFKAYLDLVWTLQDLYKLEPAGSHGVWGLDDYCFLPYIFGSSQLLHSRVPPESLLPNPTPRSALPSATTIPKLRSLNLDADDPPPSRTTAFDSGPGDDFYTMAIRRIGRIKSGPWFEHSPLLYNLATSGKSWSKIHSGLTKMYEGEVMAKRVVVQHLYVGGLISWDVSEGSS